MKKQLLILPVFHLICLSIVSGQNLILNPGFETATVGIPTGTPLPTYPAELDNWTATCVDGEFIKDSTLAYSGVGFLSVLQNAGSYDGSPWLGSSGGGYDQAGQVIAVQPSTGYTVSFWYRAGDGSRYGYGAGDLVVHVESTAPSAATLTTITASATLTWQLYTKTFVTGPNDTEAILLFAPMGADNVDIWIDDVSLEESGSVRIEEFSDADIRTYPNPVKDQLTILSDHADISYTIINAVGAIVNRGTLNGNSTTVDVSSLPKGYYVLRLTDGHSIVNRSIVKGGSAG